jgi:uncharacterized protein (TIGR03435 family)
MEPRTHPQRKSLCKAITWAISIHSSAAIVRAQLKGEPPMSLARLILTLTIAAAAPLLEAQQSPAPTIPPTAAAPVKLPTFDVISVKVNNTGARSVSMNSTPDGFHLTNIPIQSILKQAFSLNDDQIFGAPGWAQSTRFDIDAKVSGSDVDVLRALTNDQRRLLIVQILIDRFQFVYHRETRMLPEYALVVAKGGSKLQEFQPGNDAAGQPKHPGRMQMHDNLVTAQGVPLEPLIHLLSDRVGRPIEDKTGLTGTYDFTLQIGDEGHDSPAPGPTSGDGSTGPSIFTALQEQLGLKLESGKGPVQVLVVDHIEMPAAN